MKFNRNYYLPAAFKNGPSAIELLRDEGLHCSTYYQFTHRQKQWTLRMCTLCYTSLVQYVNRRKYSQHHIHAHWQGAIWLCVACRKPVENWNFCLYSKNFMPVINAPLAHYNRD